MASCALSKHYTIDRAPAPAQGRFLKGVVLETWTKPPLLKQKLLGWGGGLLTIKQVENREEQGPGAGGVSAAAWEGQLPLGVSDEVPRPRWVKASEKVLFWLQS